MPEPIQNALLALAFLACGGLHIVLRLLSLHLCNEYPSLPNKKKKKASSPTPADSASDTNSGPLLLPAKGEAVSSTSVCEEEATGKEVPRPSTFGLNTRLRQAMTVSAFELPWPGRGKSAPGQSALRLRTSVSWAFVCRNEQAWSCSSCLDLSFPMSLSSLSSAPCRESWS